MTFAERNGKDNKEMKKFILDRLAMVEYTNTYVFGIHENGLVKAVEVENAPEILPFITYCERRAKSKGETWGVRMWNASAAFEIIKAYASRMWTLCSVHEFEESFEEACEVETISGKRGEWFERMFVKYVGGVRPTDRRAPCTETGDVILDGKHLQLKFWNGTVSEEKQVNRFYEAKMKATA
jgi:uncharacterized protein YuzE